MLRRHALRQVGQSQRNRTNTRSTHRLLKVEQQIDPRVEHRQRHFFFASQTDRAHRPSANCQNKQHPQIPSRRAATPAGMTGESVAGSPLGSIVGNATWAVMISAAASIDRRLKRHQLACAAAHRATDRSDGSESCESCCVSPCPGKCLAVVNSPAASASSSRTARVNSAARPCLR